MAVTGGHDPELQRVLGVRFETLADIVQAPRHHLDARTWREAS
jgi:hypothetical protein